MPRGKKQTESIAPKPEAPPIALTRIEERLERVPLTPDQTQERVAAAAATLERASAAEAALRGLKDDAKAKAQEVAALHAEADRIILDAHSGTTAAPFPVIVERHPIRPAEMIVWRVPDGIAAAGLLAAELPQGQEAMVAREAQGCVLVEERAMMPDELEVARREDEARRQPVLPGIDAPAPPAACEVLVEQQVAVEAVPTRELPPEDWGEGDHAVAAGEVLVDSPPNAIGGWEHDVVAPTGTGKPQPGAVLCPAVLVEAEDVIEDQVCGKPGVRRRRGLCEEHAGVSGELVTRWTARRQRRQQAARARASGSGGGVEHEETATA